jgi:hypothetical protein
MSTFYSQTSVSSAPSGGSPTASKIGTGGNDDEMFRAIVRSLVDAAPPIGPFAEYARLASLDPVAVAHPGQGKKQRFTAFAATSVLVTGLFTGIGAWSLASRTNNSEAKTYRLSSLPKGAYLLEATRTAGGYEVAAQTQQLWKDPQGRYVLATISAPRLPNEESPYLQRNWSVNMFQTNMTIPVRGTPRKEVFVGNAPSFSPSQLSSDQIFAAWGEKDLEVNIERGSTILGDQKLYLFYGKGGSDSERLKAEQAPAAKKALEPVDGFGALLERLRLVDESRPMAGFVLPNGFSLVDQVVNQTRSYQTVDATHLVVKRGDAVVRVNSYEGPRRVLTLPSKVQQPVPNFYPVNPTGRSLSKGNRQIDFEVPSSGATGGPHPTSERLMDDLLTRLEQSSLTEWRNLSDRLVRNDLEVFERTVWKGMPIYLAWRKSGQASAHTAITVCIGVLSSASCTSMGGETAWSLPNGEARSVLLTDGRWVVLQRGGFKAIEGSNPQNQPNLLTSEKLPFRALDVTADLVPKDQNVYRLSGRIYSELLFRPLR